MADEGSRGRPSGRPSRSAGLPASRRPALDIEILLPEGLRVPGLAAWLTRVAPARARGTVTVAVVSDARVRTLNRTYRAKDTPTDVLSFPAAVEGEGPEASFLGDVVIARGVAARQAREAGHAIQTELRILSLHGLLHLLGYDHEHDHGQMARLERRLRRKGGLREGLIERGGPMTSSRSPQPRQRRR